MKLFTQEISFLHDYLNDKRYYYYYNATNKNTN